MADTPASPPVAYRASLLHFRDDPGANDAPDALEYFADGLLVVANGKIAQIGPHQTLLPSLPPETSVVDYSSNDKAGMTFSIATDVGGGRRLSMRLCLVCAGCRSELRFSASGHGIRRPDARGSVKSVNIIGSQQVSLLTT